MALYHSQTRYGHVIKAIKQTTIAEYDRKGLNTESFFANEIRTVVAYYVDMKLVF